MKSLKPFLKTAALMAACAVTAASMASCGQDTSWTYRTEDGKYELTSGMYIGLSMNAYNEGYTQSGIDSSTPLYDQQINSQDALDWVKNRTDTLAKKYLAVESKFDEYGLSFSNDEQTYIDSYISYYWGNMSSTYEAAGCAEKSYTSLMTNSFKESQLFFHIYGEGGEREVSEDDLRADFNDQYAHINVFQIDASDDDGNVLTGKDLELKQSLADDAVEAVKGGEDFESVKTEYTASSDSSDPSDSSSDTSSDSSSNTSSDTSSDSTDKDTDTSSYILKSNTTYPEDLVKALFSAKAGDCGSYDDGSGTIYVWTRLENDDNGFATYRNAVLQNEKWEEFTQYEQDWVNGMTFVTNDASIKKHSPKHLK